MSLRPLGNITTDLEPLLLEMLEDHDLQWGEVLNLIYGWMVIHYPGGKEHYEADNTSPVFFYGPKERLHEQD